MHRAARARIVDRVARAQHIQVVALTGMPVPCHLQRVDDPALRLDATVIRVTALQLAVEKSDVERGVVYDQFGIAKELEERLCDAREDGLVGQKLHRDSVDLDRARVDIALGVEVLVIVTARQSPVDQLDATDFNNTVSLADFQAGGFCIEHYLSHGLGFNLFCRAIQAARRLLR